MSSASRTTTDHARGVADQAAADVPFQLHLVESSQRVEEQALLQTTSAPSPVGAAHRDRDRRRATPDDREALLGTICTPDWRSWLAITEAACVRFGVELADVLAMRRRPAEVRARAAVWAELLDCGYSYPAIAREWVVDHSTVIDVVRVHEPEAAARRSAQFPGIAKARISAVKAARRAACG